MPKINLVRPNGETVELTVDKGVSIMRAATSNGVVEIIGDCGGALSCASCHVFVDEEWLDKLPVMSASEDQMLDMTAAGREGNSRLSCQLIMSDQLDGIRLEIADPQL